MTAIHRYSLPVNGQWHDRELRGDIIHVAARAIAGVVEFWAFDNPASEPETRTFQVFGTGQTLDTDAGAYIGTAITPDGFLVWHLMERIT